MRHDIDWGNVKVSPNDYVAEESSLIIENLQFQNYGVLAFRLYDASNDAAREGKIKQAKIFLLLADICELKMEPERFGVPFSASKRLASICFVDNLTLTQADYEFLSSIVHTLPNTFLRARVYDYLWSKPVTGKKNIQYAEKAVEEYIRVPKGVHKNTHMLFTCWNRAASIAVQLRRGRLDLYNKVYEFFLGKALEWKFAESGDLVQLVRIMHRADMTRRCAEQLAGRLMEEARAKSEVGRFQDAMTCYEESAGLFHKGNKDDASDSALILAANMCETLALQSNSMVAPDYFAKGMEILQTIPHARRKERSVGEMMMRLTSKLNESRSHRHEIMTAIGSDVDVTDLVSKARRFIEGRPYDDAMRAFVAVTTPTRVEKIYASTIERIRQCPIQSAITGVFYSSDNRIVARSQGIRNFNEIDQHDEHVKLMSVFYLKFEVGLAVQSVILPALSALIWEHSIEEESIRRIVERARIVPYGSHSLFVRGIKAGFDYDFATAVHILAPQVEHMVRRLLKRVGANTIHIDENGIECEIGLGSLLSLPEIYNVFDETIVFWLDALFCHPLGGNIRNEVAHGLLSEHDCHSPYSVYSWWFVWRLLYSVYLEEDSMESKTGYGDI